MVLKKPLNFEDKSSYNLVLEARDGGEEGALSAFEDIIIQIEDVQDQDPVFLNGPSSHQMKGLETLICLATKILKIGPKLRELWP